jgi:hypothetical protein
MELSRELSWNARSLEKMMMAREMGVGRDAGDGGDGARGGAGAGAGGGAEVGADADGARNDAMRSMGSMLGLSAGNDGGRPLDEPRIIFGGGCQLGKGGRSYGTRGSFGYSRRVALRRVECR